MEKHALAVRRVGNTNWLYFIFPRCTRKETILLSPLGSPSSVMIYYARQKIILLALYMFIINNLVGKILEPQQSVMFR